ncbi:alpha/beta hydrolase [Luteirhabdus pelagi]|uniref:alpha/beta hydrolase n=1 Tax=Luteirhabdus pelagi TaxID=2792783 RepID=UPI00193935EE|nr:alpha/beta hydrolase-fold protein [Luteirhabdus pelagi]
MKKLFLLIAFLFSFQLLTAQIIYETFQSERLGESRKLKIQLPRNYDTNEEKVYPIVLVLDADYLFEPVAGNVDYFSYWEDMPESIVVGVMQGDKRYDDGYYDDTNFMPADSGAAFFEFLGLELMPYIDEQYRTAKFIIAVGHDYTANFINYYLFKDPILFNGLIVLSPDLAPMMESRIPERIPAIENKLFYYLATGTDDIQGLRESTNVLNNSLKGVEAKNFNYYFDDFQDATHYSLVGRGIPNALEKIFAVYRPISKKEFSDKLMNKTTNPHTYLVEKYQIIEDLFGLTNPIRINDYIATATAAEKKEQWEALLEISKMAKKQYPDKNIGDYYMGRYYEETGEPKKAMRVFQGAFDKEETDFITVDMMLDKADKIKADFGY